MFWNYAHAITLNKEKGKGCLLVCFYSWRQIVIEVSELRM
jgi:hypothetical protein